MERETDWMLKEFGVHLVMGSCVFCEVQSSKALDTLVTFLGQAVLVKWKGLLTYINTLMWKNDWIRLFYSLHMEIR